MYVLCYHRVLPESGSREYEPYFARGTAVSTAVFARHVADASRNFECLDEARALAVLRGDLLLNRPGCWFTFDDAYSDSLEIAAPILAEHGVPASMYVSTCVLDGDSLAADRWYTMLTSAEPAVRIAVHVDSAEKRAYLRSSRHEQTATLEELAQQYGSANTVPPRGLYLDADGIRRLASLGWTVGSHAVSHPILPALDESGQRRELEKSRAALAWVLGRVPETFAYPDGAWDPALAERVREAGYAGALTLDPGRAGVGSDLRAIPRLLVRNDPEFIRSL